MLRHLQRLAPQEHLLYVADQAHVPYGSRAAVDIQAYSAGITRFLLAQGAKVIVVACNTASAAALTYLRDAFPDVPFVGMEPAVKPAALSTRSGVVGVLATPGTFASPRYASLMTRFASDVTVLEDPCIGLVDQVEVGEVDTAATAALIRQVVRPMLLQGADTLVLGCTHYPFLEPLIARIAGEEAPDVAVQIIDPAPAVARQTLHVLDELGLRAPATQQGRVQLYTSSATAPLSTLSARLLGWELPVTAVVWHGDTLATA